MIPSVEERQIRPCIFIGDSINCDCINVTWYAQSDPECKAKQEFFDARREAHGSNEVLLKYPCIYNITAEELKELIDSGEI